MFCWLKQNKGDGNWMGNLLKQNSKLPHTVDNFDNLENNATCCDAVTYQLPLPMLMRYPLALVMS